MSVKKISFKHGVTLNGIQPEMSAALPAIANCYHAAGYDCIYTSVTDGVHTANSLHYAGLAVDTRTRHMRTSHIPDLAQDIREAIGAEFDVIVESDHIHIEFDPD